MKKGIRLLGLLVSAFGITLLITSLCFYLLFTRQVEQQVQKQQQNLLFKIGHQIADEKSIQEALTKKQPSPLLQKKMQRLTKEFSLDFIVIMDMQATRFTHPNPKKIGQHFEGGDEKKALNGHESTSISTGSLGKSLRVFIPIYAHDKQAKQVGVVALGIRLATLGSIIKRTIQQYSFSLGISLLIGCSVAVLLAYSIKRQLHHLEPREIARLLEERNAMLDETKEIVVVTDLQQKILLANFKAQELYQQIHDTEQSILQQPLASLILHSEQIRLDQRQEQFYQQNGQDYFLSSAPIHVKNKQIGYILFMKNATETLFLANQLANTNTYASALQSQTHEFMNKLHVIYGLADLQAYDALKKYLDDILQPDKELTQRLALLVPQPILAGFLLGERERFQERKIQFKLEIIPEIPSSLSKTQLEQLMVIYRYINQFIIQQHLTDDLLMRFLYQDTILETEYLMMTDTSTKISSLSTYLEQDFFSEWLTQSNSQIKFVQTQDDYLKLNIQTTLKEVDHEASTDC